MITQIELRGQDALLSPDGKFAILPKDYQLARGEDGEITGVIDPFTMKKITLRWRSLDELSQKAS